MTWRRIVTAASTIFVAIALAITVPVSQLRTVGNFVECCCPDPDNCKCPDHKPDRGTQPAMQACHKKSQDFVAPVLPAFIAPAIDVASAPEQVAIAVEYPLSSPHTAPPPRRPDAPS